MASQKTTFTRDTEYYFRNVVFRVANTIFQVPRNGFEVPGTIFETMFSLPPATVGGGVERASEGSSDDNPIVLPVDEAHFRGFLRAMYPFSGQEMSNDDWLGALNLATMWMFEEIKGKAITALDSWVTETHDAKEAVLLAKKYRVLSWLKASYGRLLQKTPLTIEELSSHPALDWETMARLFYLKQETPLTNQQRTHYYYYCGTCSLHVAPGQICLTCRDTRLESVFRTEFESMDVS